MWDWKWRACSWLREKCVSLALMRNLIKATVRILLFYSHLSYSVRAWVSFRVSLPPKRHLQINEKCHNWFYSSQTTACQLCHKLSLLFSVFQVQHPHVVDSYWLVRALSCLGSGKPSDNDLLFVLLLCVGVSSSGWKYLTDEHSGGDGGAGSMEAGGNKTGKWRGMLIGVRA